jgi:hypothetical protein
MAGLWTVQYVTMGSRGSVFGLCFSAPLTSVKSFHIVKLHLSTEDLGEAGKAFLSHFCLNLSHLNQQICIDTAYFLYRSLYAYKVQSDEYKEKK